MSHRRRPRGCENGRSLPGVPTLAKNRPESRPWPQIRVRSGSLAGAGDRIAGQSVGAAGGQSAQIAALAGAHHRPESIKRFPGRIEKMPEVLECHFLTGEYDYLLKVIVTNHDHLERFLFEKLMKVDGVDRIRTSIVVKEVKASTALPL